MQRLEERVDIPRWMPPLIFGVAYLALIVHSLTHVLRSPISDAAKALWVLIVFLVPVFGVLLPYAFVPTSK